MKFFKSSSWLIIVAAILTVVLVSYSMVYAQERTIYLPHIGNGSTPQGASETPVMTATVPTVTSAPSQVPTAISTTTNTPTPIPTDTPTSIPTDTPTPIPTNTPTPIPTNTPTPIPTNTPTPIPTDTPTPIPTEINSGNLLIDISDEDAQISENQQRLLDSYKSEPTSGRTNLVRVNLEQLRGMQTLELNLFPDKSIHQQMDNLELAEEDPENNYSWFGIDNTIESDSVLVVQDGELAATVRAGEQLYQIYSLGEGLYVVIDVVEDTFPEEHPPEFNLQTASLDISTKSLLAISDASNLTVINVIVAFTPEARDQVASINAIIRLAIDETNQSFRNSNVNIHMELAHVYETNYVETGGLAVDLARFKNLNDGFMDEIHTLRDTFDADIAILIGSNNYAFCGLAADILSDASTAFAIVARPCATGYYTFGHEIGHLLGARHNPEADSGTIPFAYGHGYYYDTGGWRTVMSYNSNSSCCARIPYWSNPIIFRNNVPMGMTQTRDNARVLNETASTIASFRLSGIAALIPYDNGVITALSGRGIFLSPDGNNLTGGGDTIRVYDGTQSVVSMIPYQDGVITAFSGKGIYYSPDGNDVGGGGNTTRIYNGTDTVVSMIPYQDGVITAFSGKGIYYSPDGNDVGGSGNTIRVYNGTQSIVSMIPYQDGVITAFSGKGIYYSPDGNDVGGGGNTTRIYNGTDTVVSMIPYQDGVITAFIGRGIYYSPDGNDVGGGGNTTRIYNGSQSVIKMISYKDGVITTFSGNGVYYSPNGNNVGGGGNTVRVYSSRQRVVQMIPYEIGVLTAFSLGGIYYSPDGNNVGGGGNTIRVD